MTLKGMEGEEKGGDQPIRVCTQIQESFPGNLFPNFLDFLVR